MDTRVKISASAIFVDLENIAVTAERQRVRFDLTSIMTRAGEISRPILRKAGDDWGRFARYRKISLIKPLI